MPDLVVAATAHLPGEAAVSAMTDLAFVAGGDVLAATTGWDGGLSTWDMTGGLSRIDAAPHGRPGAAGSAPALALVATGEGQALFSGGGLGGPLRLTALAPDGGLGAATRPGSLTGIAGEMGGLVALPLGTGTIVYGAPSGGAGIARARFDGEGRLAASGTTADSRATHADGAVLAGTEIGGDTFLLSAGQRDPGVTLWQVGAAGALAPRAHLAPEDGLWIAAPAAMEVVRAGGESFAVLASAGSSSLSVIRIGAGGSLAVADHLVDDRDSRIAGVTALATATLDGRAYVVAGGADDGVSLYEVLPGGRLLARAHLADTTGTTLANVSALAMRGAAGGLDIVVASASEPGLTRLRFDPGAPGVVREGAGVLEGTAGADLLAGSAASDRILAGAGADVIRDGAGTDTLFGGAGADVFVLARDGVADRIADFDPGEDRLDLSGWAGLRSLDQIAVATLPNGLRLVYGDEVLTLTVAAGARLTAADLAALPLFGGTHLGLAGEPGLPGPGKPAPPLPPRPDDDGRPDPRGPVTDPNPEETPLPPARQRGTKDADILRGSWVSDTLAGRGGDDTLQGRGAGDVLRGGGGEDRILGGAGDDRLLGGGGDDRLAGGAGADRLAGGAGADRLRGGAGADAFLFARGGGQDTVLDMTARDRLLLDDSLWRGTMRPAEILAMAEETRAGLLLDFGGRGQLLLAGLDAGGLTPAMIEVV